MPKFLRKLEFEKVIKALWDKSKEKFVEEITFDDTIDTATNKPKNKLSKTKGGQESVVVDHVVTEWMDLDYTTQSSIKNIFDKNKQVENDKRYYFGNIENYAGCKIVKIPCKTNDEFTIIKGASHDSSQVGVYNADGTHLRQLNINHNNVNGKEVYRFTIPSDLQDASYFVTSMYENSVDINKVMVFKENVANNNIPTNYVPFSDGATVFIDSSEVALSFDGTGTSLSSATIHSAIKELDGKVGNAGGGGGTVTSVNNQNPDPQGNVTIGINNIPQLQASLNNKVDRTEVGNLANQIPRIDSTGKLVTSIIPDLAITSVQVVNEKTDAQNLVTSNSIQVGDVVVVTNDKNSVYMYNGTSQATFDTNFIELSLGEGTIKVINNQRPDATGSLTLNGTQINVNGQSNTTIQQEFDKCVRLVNGQAPINGEVTVNAGQIRAAVNGVVNNVQHYLNVISDGLKTVNTMAVSNRNKITILEAKKPPVQAGDIITTFKDNGEVYTVGGVTYLYCGVRKVVSRNNYPQLADALGLASSVNNFEYPYFADTKHTYDNGQRTGTKRTYICAKVV